MMSNRLKIGITDSSYGVYGPDRFAKIAADGYDSVDYQRFVNIESDFFNLPWNEFEAELLREREQIESLGMRVHQAHAPWRTPKDGDPEERKRWIAAMKKAIRGTSVLGASRFVVHPLMPYGWGGECPDEVIEMNDAFLADIADFAKDFGVTVCLENMPFRDFPIATPEHVRDTVDRLGKDNLKVCLDTGHAAIFSADVAASVRLLSDRLETVHIHDNLGDDDTHLIPGDGIINWDDFAASLADIGYTGVISLETSPKHREFPSDKWNEREMLLFGIAENIAIKAKKV